MKLKIALASLAVTSQLAMAQVEVKNGPSLDNIKESKVNRLIQGEKDDFYVYRVRSKGKGTSFYVEKYSKKTMEPLFSKEINLEDADDKAKIEDVEYASGNVFIFRRVYNKAEKKMTLLHQTVSSTGTVSADLSKIVDVNSEKVEFVDFDVFPNPSRTKFLIKSCHKATAEEAYVTDLILFDAVAKKTIWTKTVNRNLKSSNFNEGGAAIAGMLGGAAVANAVSRGAQDVGFVGLLLDDQDNFYYGYTEVIPGKGKEDISRYKLFVSVMNSPAREPIDIEAKFDADYYVKDVEFSKTSNNEIILGGFVKDIIERKGVDIVNVGIFSFTFDLTTNAVKSNAVKIFDPAILAALESRPALSRFFKYKLDYIMPINGDVFFIGEQYSEQAVNSKTAYGMSSVNWQYEYMDVIVAKLNKSGQFEWVKNTPLRNAVVLSMIPHVFKQYIAVAGQNDIYIIANEHPKNMAIYEKPDFKPRDLKTVNFIHGSNCVSSQISMKDGSIKHTVVFPNETYCFAPIQERNYAFMPPSDTEIFVPGENGDLYIYTEDKGADRFTKLTIK